MGGKTLMTAMIDPNMLENLRRSSEELRNNRHYKSKAFLSKSCNKMIKMSQKIVNSPKGLISQDDCILFRKQLDSIKKEMEQLTNDKILLKEDIDKLELLIANHDELLKKIESRY